MVVLPYACAQSLSMAAQRLGQLVDSILYTQGGFVIKPCSGHHSLKPVLDGEKRFILGDPQELAAATRHPPGVTAYHVLPGAGKL
jgi:hypothetical protein